MNFKVKVIQSGSLINIMVNKERFWADVIAIHYPSGTVAARISDPTSVEDGGLIIIGTNDIVYISDKINTSILN